MDSKQMIEVLKQIPLFVELNKHNLELLSRIIVVRNYAKGDIIVNQGDNGIGFYIIATGHVEVYRQKEETRLKLSELQGGDFFGEMALFEDSPRTATVIATEPTTCYVITSWHFKGAIESNPGIAAQMLTVLAKRYSKAAAEFL
jgi:CRP/FNR family transcriptional regulator